MYFITLNAINVNDRRYVVKYSDFNSMLSTAILVEVSQPELS